MSRTVQDVMTTDVAVVIDTMPFKELVALMHRRSVSALPVVDARGAVVGIVSEADLLLKEEFGPMEDGHPLRLRGRRDRVKAAGFAAGR